MGKVFDAFAAFVGGVIAGLALGYVGAVLLAPKEGSETRAQFLDAAGSARLAPGQVVSDVQGRVQRAVEEGRKAAAVARDELETAAGFHGPDPAPDRPASPSAI